MIYYSYTADTSEFIGQGTAQPDPLESKKQGKEVFLLPRNATFTPLPEEKDGFARCWNGMAWEYVEDNRGTEYWLPADTWEAPAREMKELGALPDGALLERPAKLCRISPWKWTAWFLTATKTPSAAYPLFWRQQKFRGRQKSNGCLKTIRLLL